MKDKNVSYDYLQGVLDTFMDLNAPNHDCNVAIWISELAPESDENEAFIKAPNDIRNFDISQSAEWKLSLRDDLLDFLYIFISSPKVEIPDYFIGSKNERKAYCDNLAATIEEVLHPKIITRKGSGFCGGEIGWFFKNENKHHRLYLSHHD